MSTRGKADLRAGKLAPGPRGRGGAAQQRAPGAALAEPRAPGDVDVLPARAAADAAAPGRRPARAGGLGAGALLVRVRERHHRRGRGVNAGCWFEGHGPIIIGRDCFSGPR